MGSSVLMKPLGGPVGARGVATINNIVCWFYGVNVPTMPFQGTNVILFSVQLEDMNNPVYH